MIVLLTMVLSTIEYSVRWLVSNEDVCIIRYVLYYSVVCTIYDVLHKHRHAIELYVVYNNRRVTEIVGIVWQSFNILCSIHADIVVACDEHLMFIG